MSDEELRIGTRDEVLEVERDEMLDSEKRDEMKEQGRVMGRCVFRKEGMVICTGGLSRTFNSRTESDCPFLYSIP
jgi:hypothetical protein